MHLSAAAAFRHAAPRRLVPTAAATIRATMRLSSSLSAAAALDTNVPTLRDRKTKVVCTIGPASISSIEPLILAGMDVARINCAHGDKENYAAIVANVRAATAMIRANGTRPVDVDRCDCSSVAIAFDIKGPEIRTGKFGASVPAVSIASTDADGKVTYSPGNKAIPVKRGDVLTLTCDPAAAEAGTAACVYINYPHLARQVAPGQLIYIDDGNVELEVTAVDVGTSRLTAVSRTTAPLGERKGVNLPGLAVDLPHVTAKDEVDIATAKALGADFLFASFVQSAAMVHAIRAVAGPSLHIM